VSDFLTVKEAAKQLKKSPSTVRRLIRDRKLKAQKLAGKFGVYIIERSDMWEYLMSKMMSEASKNATK
jgi:excisionase family DNA binding protein